MRNYLRACGVCDGATTEAVTGTVVSPPPATPRELVDQIHAELTARGMGATVQPMLPQVSPPELPGAMPRHELAPVWSLWVQPAGAVFRRTFGIACGGLFAFLLTLFDHGQ